MYSWHHISSILFLKFLCWFFTHLLVYEHTEHNSNLVPTWQVEVMTKQSRKKQQQRRSFWCVIIMARSCFRARPRLQLRFQIPLQTFVYVHTYTASTSEKDDVRHSFHFYTSQCLVNQHSPAIRFSEQEYLRILIIFLQYVYYILSGSSPSLLETTCNETLLCAFLPIYNTWPCPVLGSGRSFHLYRRQ